MVRGGLSEEATFMLTPKEPEAAEGQDGEPGWQRCGKVTEPDRKDWPLSRAWAESEGTGRRLTIQALAVMQRDWLLSWTVKVLAGLSKGNALHAQKRRLGQVGRRWGTMELRNELGATEWPRWKVRRSRPGEAARGGRKWAFCTHVVLSSRLERLWRWEKSKSQLHHDKLMLTRF